MNTHPYYNHVEYTASVHYGLRTEKIWGDWFTFQYMSSYWFFHIIIATALLGHIPLQLVTILINSGFKRTNVPRELSKK